MKRYSVKTYNKEGDYLGIVNKYTFGSFKSKINGGLGELEFTIKQNIKDFDLSGKYGLLNELRIDYQNNYTGSSGDRLYSGKIVELQPQKGNELRGVAVGYISELANRRVQKSVNGIQYSISTTQTSDILKNLVINYRAQFSDVSLSENAPVASADTTFGDTRWVGQKFTTTGLTAEQRIITGVRVRLKYNAGTAGNLGCYLYDSDGGLPALPNAAVTNLAVGSPISNATYKTFDFYFDAPYTMSDATDYFIILKSQTSDLTDTYHWESDADYYADGYKVASDDDGGTWADDDTLDCSFELLYVDESKVKINYTSDSIDDSNDSQTLKIQLDTYKEAIDRAVKYGPANWYWFLDEDNVLHYHRYGMQSMEVENCDSSAAMTPTNCTLTEIDDNIKEGIGAVQIDLDGTGTANKVEIIPYAGVWDMSNYHYSACWVYIPDLSGISYIDFTFWNLPAIYVTYRVVRGTLKTGWSFLLAKIALAGSPIGAVGIIDWSVIDQVDIVIETTAAAINTTGFIIDDWRAANLYHHDLFWQKDWDIQTIFDIRELSNDFLFYNNQTGGSEIISQYLEDNSISKYDRYHSHESDERVTTQATADLRGHKELLEKAYPRTTIEGVVVRVPYNFESIRPGHTISLLNVPIVYQNLLEERMIVTEVVNNPDSCELTLTKETPMITRKVDDLEKKDQDTVTDNLPANFS